MVEGKGVEVKRGGGEGGGGEGGGGEGVEGKGGGGEGGWRGRVKSSYHVPTIFD